MAASGEYLTMLWDPNKSRPVYLNRENKLALTAKGGMAIRVPFAPERISTMSFLDTANSAPVDPLQVESSIPAPVVKSFNSGAPEEYAANLGWRYEDTIPAKIHLSYLLHIRDGGLHKFNIVTGGKAVKASFPFSALLGLEGRTAGSQADMISCTIDPANIHFDDNMMVSAWGPLSAVFRGSLSHAGVNHDWTTGPGVYARYRVIPTHDSTNPQAQPTLALEAAVLENGYTWAGLPTPIKTALSKSSSSAIRLWDMQVAWHKPIAPLHLPTKPGVNYCNPAVPPISDFITRWSMAYIDNQGRKGGTISTKEGWSKYLSQPDPTYPTTLAPFRLVVPFTNNPIMIEAPTGNISLPYHQAKLSQPKSITFIRKGQKITRQRKISLPKPLAKPKYSSKPLDSLKLVSTALPPGTPQSIIDTATAAFAASVSTSTQSMYKTVLGHLQKAEAVLGHEFSNPPSEEEMVFFTSYLAQRKVAASTIKSYLSAFRYIALSRGAPHHTKLPELGAQIVTGSSNLKKDARAEASKPKRRPITLHIMQLLQHGIASHQSWTDYEKSLRWSVMLLGFWGSFRMGELLETEKFNFNPSNSLLPSDLKFHEDSVSVWIRNPKIWRMGGDIIEVWAVKENVQLDPVVALKHFLSLRQSNLGPAEDCPVFLHQDGSQYTKADLNNDIKQLLSTYPTLSSPQDKYSGHSFRAGLATLLSSLGFTEDQIKNWGRWSSMSYRAYVQDQSKRRETRKQITNLFGVMLSKL